VTRVETIHRVTEDLESPTYLIRDKRGPSRWYDEPVIKSGHRLLVIRDDGGFSVKKPNLEVHKVVIQEPDRHYGGQLTFWEKRTPRSPLVTLRIHGDEAKDLANLSKIDQRRLKAKAALIRALLATLSEPIRDFDSVYITAGIEAKNVLHRLYLAGAISLEQIEAEQAAIEAEEEAAYRKDR
jgi:hypothetical protein